MGNAKACDRQLKNGRQSFSRIYLIILIGRPEQNRAAEIYAGAYKIMAGNKRDGHILQSTRKFTGESFRRLQTRPKSIWGLYRAPPVVYVFRLRQYIDGEENDGVLALTQERRYARRQTVRSRRQSGR